MTPPRTRRHVRLTLAAVTLSLLGLVAACGSTGSDSSGSSASSDSAGSSSDSSGDLSSDRSSGSGGSTAADAPAALAQDASSGAADTEDAGSSGAQGGLAAPDVRSEKAVISTGTVALRAKDVDRLAFDVQEAVDQYRGEISERTSDSDDDGHVVRSRLVVRVPAESFGDLMGALEKTGTLDRSNSSSEDVTGQVIDNRVRVQVQKDSIDRIRALLAQAVDLKDVVSIEAELSARQAELNSLEQTQAYLADQTSLSTITVTMRRTDARTAPVREDDDAGFVAGLRDGWDALSGFGTAAATVAGALLPWAVVALVVGVPGLALTRRLRRRTAAV